MSKAYVCDKCGKMTREPMREVWVVNPGLFASTVGDYSIELCAECYGLFKSEYMENLIENGGAL